MCICEPYSALYTLHQYCSVASDFGIVDANQMSVKEVLRTVVYSVCVHIHRHLAQLVTTK